MARPAVKTWRGAPVKFRTARVFTETDPDLADALRSRSRQVRGRPVAIDLFCGAGGLSLGLELGGFHVLMGADSDPASCETHARAFRGVTVQCDLSQPKGLMQVLKAAGIERVQLVAGGPPCQPFSRAGRSKIRSLERKGGRPPDTRPRLWLAFLAFVDALSPDMVLLENVPDMVLWEGGQTLRRVCSELERRGYQVQARVLDCWQYGVPQHRKRLFVLGSRVAVTLPEPDTTQPSLRDAIGDLPVVGPAHRDYWTRYNGEPFTELQKRLRNRRAKRVTDHVTKDVRSDDREAFRLLRDGKRYAELPDHLKRYRDDIFDDKYHILSWESLSRSITAHIAKDGYWYIHPEGERMLSIREAARLQTFPDRFRFAGHPSDRLRQIGNAVPVEVGRRLARSIVKAMRVKNGGAEVAFRASEFRRRLMGWHARKARHYPWRQQTDTWLVLCAEMLLRRTRADAVAKVWPNFWWRFGTPSAVVADPDGFRQTVHPLGLRWRVENMIKVAQHLVNECDGRVPTSREGLVSLPGVGDYVADAVRAFTQHEPAVLVDSNTARVASRVFGLPMTWTSLRNLDLRASVARLAGARPPTPELNLALLDLGGTVCLPTNPKCPQCPVRSMCRYGMSEAAADSPPSPVKKGAVADG